MKKQFPVLVLSIALILALTACGKSPAAETPAPTAEPQVTAEPQPTAETPAPVETPAPTPVPETPAPVPAETPTWPVPAPARQDGERFQSVIMMEGMEEPVNYEHIRNADIGIEMDFDYESFVRRTEMEREVFFSDWDDPNNPEYYLEVTYSPADAETITASYSDLLSKEYDITLDTRTLDNGVNCTRIEASVIKGTNQMADRLQAVYIIPAPDGCRVATAHYFIEGAEGFGRRFDYMIRTITAFPRVGGTALPAGAALTDGQALAAIVKYCTVLNPDLQEIVDAGEYPTYWDILDSSEQEVVVVFRSYTGAQSRYHIDRVTGNTYVTEFVPGIFDEEQPTEEQLNAWDYVG